MVDDGHRSQPHCGRHGEPHRHDDTPRRPLIAFRSRRARAGQSSRDRDAFLPATKLAACMSVSSGPEWSASPPRTSCKARATPSRSSSANPRPARRERGQRRTAVLRIRRPARRRDDPVQAAGAAVLAPCAAEAASTRGPRAAEMGASIPESRQPALCAQHHRSSAEARRALARVHRAADRGERIECDFTRGGKLVLYPDAPSLEAAAGADDVPGSARHRGQVVLSAAQCVEREPAIAGYVSQFVGGVWTPTEAAADCGAFCTQIAALLARRGAEIQYGRTVERFDVVDGRVPRLITDAGPCAPTRFVLAAGDAAAALGRSAGLDLPVLPLKGYSITVRPEAGVRLPRASITDIRRKIVFAPLGDTVARGGLRRDRQ